MMMVHDSLSREPALEAETLAALDAVLRRHLAANGSIADVEPALRLVATEARQKQMRAEHLLVVLKDVWYSLPGVNHAQEGVTQDAALQRVVSCCIRAYYSP
jgi:hypothetical protein